MTYPLRENQSESLQAASGRALPDITLEALATGELSIADLQIRAETLLAQAKVAEQAGHAGLAMNLRRAAELTRVPNAELLRMYEALRPGRSTVAELETLALRLEQTYNAPICATLVREAARIYQERHLVRG